MFYIGKTTAAREWEALTDLLIEAGLNFVVLDNLMGATGDTNNPEAVTTVFDGMTRLTNHGIPVVVIHHESEHGSSQPGRPPMGASVIIQKARAWIQVRQTARRNLNGGNTVLVIHSNGLARPQQVVAEPMTGPAYRVLNRGPWHTEDKPKPDASAENTRVAAWIVDNCQGLGVNKVATALVDKFPSRSQATWKDQLIRGELATLLVRAGKDASTSWSWPAAA
jgi:hypothetical protein